MLSILLYLKYIKFLSIIYAEHLQNCYNMWILINNHRKKKGKLYLINKCLENICLYQVWMFILYRLLGAIETLPIKTCLLQEHERICRVLETYFMKAPSLMGTFKPNMLRNLSTNYAFEIGHTNQICILCHISPQHLFSRYYSILKCPWNRMETSMFSWVKW